MSMNNTEASTLRAACDLNWALECGDEALARDAMARGARIAENQVQGAAAMNHFEQLELMLKLGATADVDEMLTEAILLNHPQVARVLLAQGADAKAPEILRKAVAEGSVEIVRLLLEHGADATQPGLLEELCFFPNAELAQVLLDSGARDGVQKILRENILWQDDSPLTGVFLKYLAEKELGDILDWAVFEGNVALVGQCLDARPALLTERFFLMAVDFGGEKLLRLLLERDVEKHVLQKALREAEFMENDDAARLLREYGAER